MSRDPFALLQRRFEETQRLAKLGSWELELGDFPLVDGPLWWSAETYRLLGYEPGYVVPTMALYLERLPHGDREPAVAALKAAINSGVYDTIHRIEPKPGMFRVVKHNALLIRNESEGRALRMVGTLQDITERVGIERLLQVTREELEDFSHAISHDLRAPLRHIDGFARILQVEHAANLLPEAREHLQRIVRSTARMASLIDGLLEFTRVGQQVFSESALDMETVAEGALEQLRSAGEGRNVAWVRGPLPPAWGDAALLHQVWVQLLGNALKFTRSRDPARIAIGAEQAGEDTWYYVEDNGAGFDPQYATRLFTLFQRLHRAEEFEGSGVGLAIARRVVQRHGGRIEAHGEAGRGARVRFCLPRATPR